MRCGLKLLSLYYRIVSDSDIINYLVGKRIRISWVVEAGCHDGEDTLRISKMLNPVRIVAFEPDGHARLKAIHTYAVNNLEVELFEFGLSDTNSKLFLNYLNGEGGSGSTFLSKSGDFEVEVRRLDDLDLDLSYGGMLWLDVEGHAVQVLQGATNNLHNLAAAKIEIQMHKMSDTRIADFVEVNKIMHSHGLMPVKAPIFPGYFGDVIYVNSRELKLIDKICSYSLRLQMRILHGFLYPLLKKPK